MNPDPTLSECSQARDAVLARIRSAAREAARDPDGIELVAVSKQQPWPRVGAMLATGQRVFGENRVQDAKARWSEQRIAVPDLQLRMIGPLQSNKAEEAAAFFDVIETLDREKLAGALADAAGKLGRAARLYIQINTGEEPQKAGLAPRDADSFIELVRRSYGLALEGLMCIPPADEPPGPHFALLRKIAERNGLDRLSMGMSSDFETAVRFGATSVRVGSALFGEREPRSA